MHQRSGPNLSRNRNQKAVRIDHRKVAGSPGLVPGLLGELAASTLDDGGELVDVLAGDAVETERNALRPVSPLGEVVLPEQEFDAPRLQANRHEAVLMADLLRDDEAENVPVPTQAGLQIVDRSRRASTHEGAEFPAAVVPS